MAFWLNWLESRTSGINQRVPRISRGGGARGCTIKVWPFFMFYIYVLYSLSIDLYYVGYTADYLRRLHQHNFGTNDTFTSKHKPWQLKAVFAAGENEGEAMRIEKFIKKQKSRKLIEKMIAGDTLDGVLAQLVRVPDIRD